MRCLILLFLVSSAAVASEASTVTSIEKEMADLGRRAKVLGCQPLGGFQVVAKLAENKYEITYRAGTQVLPCPPPMGTCPARFGPVTKSAILKTTKTQFSSDGTVDALMARKTGETKVPLRNGFEESWPVFEESLECKEIAERGSALIDKKSEIEDFARQKREIAEEQRLEREERAQQRIREQKEQGRQKKLEEFYE